MALVAYLDASFLVAVLTQEVSSPRAQDFLTAYRPDLIISDFAAAEFASAIARKTRTGELRRDEAQWAFDDFDIWAAAVAEWQTVTPADLGAAEALLRRLDLTLRTPDAIHIAMAMRLRSELVTLDKKLAQAAQAIGAALAPI